MELEASHKKILEYLHEYGSVNTFRLSRHLQVDRHELIAIIKDLTKKRLVEFKHGSVSINENRYQKLAENKEEKPAGLPKPLAVPEILNKPRLKKIGKPKTTKKRYSELGGFERKIQRLENKWSKKEEKLRNEIEDLEVQRNCIAQKLAEERKLLKTVRKERKKAERDLAEKEKSLRLSDDTINALGTLKKLGGDKEEIETKGPVIKKDLMQLIEIAKEKNNDEFHDLIEQEISLLKQKRINEAREIHLQIKDMLSSVVDTYQRENIIRDWRRIKEFC